MGVVKLSELIGSIIVLSNLWKLESFFLEDLLGVDFEDSNWMNTFLVNFSPLTHGVLVVRHVESSAELVPFFIHLGDISSILLLLLRFDLGQFLESCLLLFLDLGKFNLILFLLLFLLIELLLQLLLHFRDIKISSGDRLSNLMLSIFMNNIQAFLRGGLWLLSHNLLTSSMWFVLNFNVEFLFIESGLNILAILILVNESKHISIPLFHIKTEHFDAVFALMSLELLFQEGLFKSTELSCLRF